MADPELNPLSIAVHNAYIGFSRLLITTRHSFPFHVGRPAVAPRSATTAAPPRTPAEHPITSEQVGPPQPAGDPVEFVGHHQSGTGIQRPSR